jgi:hypothetical protein
VSWPRVGAVSVFLDDLAVDAGRADGPGQDPLFPCRGDLGRQAQGVDPRVMDLQVPPERQAAQAGVVEHRLAFVQIGMSRVRSAAVDLRSR